MSVDEGEILPEFSGGVFEVVAFVWNISTRLSVTLIPAESGVRDPEDLPVRLVSRFLIRLRGRQHLQIPPELQRHGLSKFRNCLSGCLGPSAPRSAKASAAAAISCTSRRPLGKVGVEPGIPFLVSVSSRSGCNELASVCRVSSPLLADARGRGTCPSPQEH